MRYSKDKLYSLIPAIYRLRDAKLGQPLEDLINIIAEEVSIIEDDIEQLYDDWFIETCTEWVIPYIGDSVAAQILSQPKRRDTDPPNYGENASTISSRAWVANTLSYRRRKGTVAVLEQIAKDITDWEAKAVEFFKLLSVSQNINHLSPGNQFADIRKVIDLDVLGTPFENTSHTTDIRNIKSGSGFHNIQNIGIFLWRIQPYPVNDCPAFYHGDGKYSFNQLGIDAPLFNHPVTEGDNTHPAGEINLPIIIKRSILRENIDLYYGIDKSLLVEVDGSVLPSHDIAVDSLADWKRPPQGKIAVIDPILGRMTFQSAKIPGSVKTSYYYGFTADIGGGFYDRQDKYYGGVVPLNIALYRISKTLVAQQIFNSLAAAIIKWSNDGKPSAIIEILDSEFYELESVVDLSLPSDCVLIIRSAEHQRPVFRCTQPKEHQTNNRQQQQESYKVIEISGEKGSCVIFDGLWLDASCAIRVKRGQLGVLQFIHCTLVPDNKKRSIEIQDDNDQLNVLIYRSICGKIYASLDRSSKFDIIDSIVDGNSTTLKENDNRALHNPKITGNDNTCKPMGENHSRDEEEPNTIVCSKLNIQNSTILGKVSVSSVNASNTIFTECIIAKRRQEGCMRFSYVAEGSITPKRYRCQPEEDDTKITNKHNPLRIIKPKFGSVLYGDPAYAQLHKNVDTGIFEGADNESEMGVFNNLYQSHRIKHLKSALDEYLRYGIEAGIILIDLGGKNHENRYH